VNARTQKELNDTFIALTSNEKPYMMDLEVQGRSLHVPEVFGGIAKLSFNELCSKALGASDYIAIAQHFHTVLLSGIPKLTPEKRNEAKRFITLIDTLYEHKVKLICTADDRPEKLYTEGDGAFEFGRTVSRLVEMQSERYLSTNHQIIKIVQPQYASNA
jgi:cell division protein ZapE